MEVANEMRNAECGVRSERPRLIDRSGRLHTLKLERQCGQPVNLYLDGRLIGVVRRYRKGVIVQAVSDVLVLRGELSPHAPERRAG